MRNVKIMLKPTIIFRHKRENLKKCSLRGLESRDDFCFFSYPMKQIPIVTDYIVLTLGAKELTIEDKSHGLILVDATWKLADDMLKMTNLEQKCIARSLPSHFRTAYPRRQTLCSDPQKGLASIEALYIAFKILGKDTSGILDNYYWKEQFLALNPTLHPTCAPKSHLNTAELDN
jgi:pre-rRNA-processing protein TSR3